MADYSQFFPSGGEGKPANYSQFFPEAPPGPPAPMTEHRGFVPNTVAPPAPRPAQPSLFKPELPGVLDAGLSMLSAIPAALVGQVAGVGRTLTSGEFGTPKGIQMGQDTARNVSEAMTYQPRTEAGKSILSGVGGVLSESKVAGMGPVLSSEIGVLARPATTQAGALATRGVEDVFRPQPAALPGFGSAMTSPEELRRVRAGSLPIPIDITKGQATRTFEQQQFEREAAKMPYGGPLRERFAEQNSRMLGNFDAWVDETGAMAPELRATGQIVTQAIADKANSAKEAITKAYTEARASGELQSPVDVSSLIDYLHKRRAQSINAGVIGSTRSELEMLAGPQKKDVFGQPVPRIVTLNDLEEVRKSVNAASGKDATNAFYGKEIKTLIDQLTDNAGGETYKYARRLRSQYASEFENVGVIDKLMSTKPGTRDRAVAYEDVFNHSVLQGSLDDVRAVRKTLQTAGEGGEQAWRELQGQTVNYLKESASRNAQRDIRGNPIVSFAGFDRAVKDLDRDGKLEFIFGKRGAQQVRDMRDLAADVHTSPPGSVNTSNTNSAFWTLARTLPFAKTVQTANELLSTRKQRALVNQALSQ